MTQHLIHVGFPKAGSTYVQHWFEAHPQIRFTNGGVAGFATVFEMVRRIAEGDTEGAKTWCVTSSESLTAPLASPGPIELGYHLSGKGGVFARQVAACRLLASLFPNAHVLIVTRGFRSMILSSYSQYIRGGGTADFPEAMRLDGENPWQYDRLVQLYRDSFAGRVILLPYELLAADPVAFRGELERRLGVEPFDFANGRVNAGLTAAELHWYPRIGRAARRLPGGKRLFRLYLAALRAGRLRAIAKALDRLRPAPTASHDAVPAHVLETMRGHAASLRDEPLYAPFASDYLFDPPGDGAGDLRAIR
jgi:hypothetical protein